MPEPSQVGPDRRRERLGETRFLRLGYAVLLPLGALIFAASASSRAQDDRPGPNWRHLSSKMGELPIPGESTQQTACVVADIDGDGLNDFVLGFREKGPALVWCQRSGSGWKRRVIEREMLTIEAGGAVHDVDGDGDLDLVFGGDYQSPMVWWWENPGSGTDRIRPGRGMSSRAEERRSTTIRLSAISTAMGLSTSPSGTRGLGRSFSPASSS